MRELFVYYRIDPAAAAATREAVEAMQARLRSSHPGLVARLLVRDEDGSAPQTWMETYALPGSREGVDRRLEAAIAAEAEAWSHRLVGPRHVEAFSVAGPGG
jgi:hypothetical protein